MAKETSVEIKTSYEEKISRLAIFRGLWSFVIMWPLIPWGIWVYLMVIVYFLVVLFGGKRNKYAWECLARTNKWAMRWSYYVSMLTDERPGFLPWEEEL